VPNVELPSKLFRIPQRHASAYGEIMPAAQPKNAP